MKVSKTRHLVKAITWRLIASLTTALIGYAFGLPLNTISLIFVVDLVIKFILYYTHERFWYKYIQFGLK